jgi:hypothetical protein
MFRFRLRSPSRDRETDESRLDRIERLLDQLLAEIDAERSGLRNRYDSAVSDAAFLLDSIENETPSASSTRRSDELTTAVNAFELRMRNLEKQHAFFSRIRQSASPEAMAIALAES